MFILSSNLKSMKKLVKFLVGPVYMKLCRMNKCFLASDISSAHLPLLGTNKQQKNVYSVSTTVFKKLIKQLTFGKKLEKDKKMFTLYRLQYQKKNKSTKMSNLNTFGEKLANGKKMFTLYRLHHRSMDCTIRKRTNQPKCLI